MQTNFQQFAVRARFSQWYPDEFLEVFDGHSVGSSDLTPLVPGPDRNSGTVARHFDERDGAARWMIAHAVATAKHVGKPIGICGRAPSDYPDFARWLVEQGINSISLNPDSAIKTAFVIADAEAAAGKKPPPDPPPPRLCRAKKSGREGSEEGTPSGET